jgi:UDP-N-acetylglucosamine--N-acetylmuramyl-(pentapeptide) pyrophosphoryl-undecaprenol N-acetylglucosamine transferase
VREAFFTIPAKSSGAPTLLVFGGSQGARAINQAMTTTESLTGLREKVPGIHIIHQTGQRDYDQVLAAYQKSGISSEVHKFIDDMPATFARADLLVCRSGASTVGEITAAGKPAIFVPFPAAADDHQNVNARALERAGAAVVVEESNLDAAYLVDTIAALIGDAHRLQSMSTAAKSMAHPKAVEEIAEMVKQLAGGE